ncbi:MAG: hypothetical protein WCJ49_04490 [Deltaproteobacteria bacterium]
MNKKFVFWGMIVGSMAGGYFSDLLGFGMLTFTSLFVSTIGAIVGIWFAYWIIK